MLVWLGVERRSAAPFDAFLSALSMLGVPFEFVSSERVHLKWFPILSSVRELELANKTPSAFAFSSNGVGGSISGRYLASPSPSIFQFANLLRLISIVHSFVVQELADHWYIVSEAVSREEAGKIDLRYALATFPIIESSQHYVFDNISIHRRSSELLWEQEAQYRYKVELP